MRLIKTIAAPGVGKPIGDMIKPKMAASHLGRVGQAYAGNHDVAGYTCLNALRFNLYFFIL